MELTDEQPLLELRLFKNRTFALAMLVNFVLTVGMFGGQLLVPLFLQSFRGLGAAETGLITMTQALAMLPLMPLVGKLADRFGTRTILLVGLPLVALSMWQFSGLTMDTSDTQLRLWLAARGVTMGLVMMPAMTAALNTVPAELTSRGSSLTNVMRQVFGSFGTAIFVTLLQSRQMFHASALAQGVTTSNYTLQQTLGQVQQWVLAHGGSALQAQAEGLGAVMRQIQLTAAVQSFDDVFMVAALITLLALVPAIYRRSRRGAGSRRSVARDGISAWGAAASVVRDELVERIVNLQAQIAQLLESDRALAWLDVDLTIQQIKAVFILVRAGSLTAGQIGRELRVGFSTVTGLVDRLAEQGLVSRGEDPKRSARHASRADRRGAGAGRTAIRVSSRSAAQPARARLDGYPGQARRRSRRPRGGGRRPRAGRTHQREHL